MSTFLSIASRSLPRAAVNLPRCISRYSSGVAFQKSPVPPNPGEGHQIKTVAFLSIGSILPGSRVTDSNSYKFSRFCKVHGVELLRIELIENEESKIIEASQRMAQDYDLVVVTGGTGSKETDITYASIAKAFDLTLEEHAETLQRMDASEAARLQNVADAPLPEQPADASLPEQPADASLPEQPADASRPEKPINMEGRKRMAKLPSQSDVLFVGESVRQWMPAVLVKGKLCILPALPGVFARMIYSLAPYLHLTKDPGVGTSTARTKKQGINDEVIKKKLMSLLNNLKNTA